MKESVRIIGGKFKGKNLSFPAVEGLRPTPQRIRETLFNWLMHDIKGATVCDAFSGSGALGFEAFSRGALYVVLLEKSHQAYCSLKKSAAHFASPQLQVIHQDALEYFKQTTVQFDLIFLDPPFSEHYYEQMIPLLETGSFFQEGGLLYLESPEFLHLNTAHWRCLKQKKAGMVCYGLYQKIPINQPAPLDTNRPN